jgi:hypothetical protein
MRQVAHEIDARTFDPNFPATFPEFVQHALWAFCAQGGLDVCATAIRSMTGGRARTSAVPYSMPANGSVYRRGGRMGTDELKRIIPV